MSYLSRTVNTNPDEFVEVVRVPFAIRIRIVSVCREATSWRNVETHCLHVAHQRVVRNEYESIAYQWQECSV